MPTLDMNRSLNQGLALTSAFGMGRSQSLTLCFVAISVFLLTCGGVEEPGHHADSSSVVAAVADDYATFITGLSPYLQFRRGETITEFPDTTLDAAQDSAQAARGLLDRLSAVDESAISHEEWISLELLRWDLELLVEGAQHYWADFNITPYSAGSVLSIYHQILGAAPLVTEGDQANYLNLLDQYAKSIGHLADKVAGQKEREIYLPKPQVPNVVTMFTGFRDRAEALFLPSAERLGDAPDAYLAQIEDAVTTGIRPELQRLIDELGNDYLEAAPNEVGLAAVPGGPELYRYRVKLHSTTNLGPDEIHQIGLDEVARLEAEMAELRKQIGFEGHSEETAMKDFLDQVRVDPKFIATSPEEVEARYMSYVAQIEPQVGHYFDVLPKAPYGVRRLDRTNEATMTFGIYQLPTPANPRGEYRYNGSDLENRSLFSAQGLIYHELIPGHHFQLALAYENEELPRFRREAALYSAYTEGWAEYAANLGKEMGLFDDPYDRYGRLVMEMFVSCRLVVDTGLNHLGWDLERARDYLAARIVYSEVEIATELMRYSADLHGQALAYRMGYLEITRLRHMAEDALGEAFDIKRFHAAVIGSGAMPMVVLEKHIDWWIEQERAKSPK